MSSDLYIIRGTGFNIDGNIVEIVEGSRTNDGYVNVSPFYKSASQVSTKSVLIHEKYLQRIDNTQKRFTYRIVISKRDENSDSEMYTASEIIHDALRDINIFDLAKKIANDLAPILRLRD